MKKNEHGFSAIEIIIVIVIIGLIGTVGWLVYDRQNNKPNNLQSDATQSEKDSPKPDDSSAKDSSPKTLAKGTFGDNGEYGTLQAEGYSTTVKRNEAECQENCKQYDYVFFNITRTENTNIFSYLKKLSGNSAVQNKAIGMGCIADGQISYFNSSDSKGSVEYKLTMDDTSAVMASTAEKPVALDIERLQYSTGKGAPTCYSHFTTFKVIK